MEKFDALMRIYDNLQRGCKYGKMETNCRWPVFHTNMCLNTTGDYIRYNNFGSSAIKNAPAELLWVIDIIFRTTPEEFEKEYEMREPETR